MHRFSMLLSAAGLSCLIAFVLAYAAGLREPTREGHDMETVTHDYGVRLTDDNIVDYMAHMPITLGIRKVDWREPVLYIDLYVQDYETEREVVFADIRDVCMFALQSVRNVGKVMIRIYDSPRGSSSLLMAVSADSLDRRELAEWLRDGGSESESEQLVRQVFQVQETPRWPLLFGES
jgi:hypothetical protein